MKVAGEVEIDLLHRRDLRKAAAGGAAFLAEAGAERGFAQADRDAFADARQRVAEADRRRRLAFARRGRIDGGDEHELAVGLSREPGEKFVVDLGGRASVGVQGRIGNVELGADRDMGARGIPRAISLSDCIPRLPRFRGTGADPYPNGSFTGIEENSERDQHVSAGGSVSLKRRFGSRSLRPRLRARSRRSALVSSTGRLR